MSEETDAIEQVQVTCSAPVNIAVVKYWGKRDEKQLLPVNSSISGTLSMDDLKTTTTVSLSEQYESDKMWLNGEETPIGSNERLVSVLALIRGRAGKVLVNGEWWSAERASRARLHIVSVNNFPTAAGLASSASGYACLVYTLAKLFNVTENFPGELSSIARRGSGSACRSLFGGWVKWEMGVKEDGSDSLAVQVAPRDHFPLAVLVLVVSDAKKATSSTSGMRRTVATSELMAYRMAELADKRCSDMAKAIAAKDFPSFAKLTMQDSNQFHAVCLDTYPPIFYLNDVSRRIIRILSAYNEDEIKVAYTFDAGPNAVLYLPESRVADVLALIQLFFPPSKAEGFIKGTYDTNAEVSFSPSLIDKIGLHPVPESLKYIIKTKLGTGPVVEDAAESLITAQGLPKTD